MDFKQQPNKSVSGTNIQKVRQQNANAASGSYGTEFGSEISSQTDVQAVREANAKAEAKKTQNSSNFQNPQQ